MGIRGSEGDRKHCRACPRGSSRGPTPPQRQNLEQTFEPATRGGTSAPCGTDPAARCHARRCTNDEPDEDCPHHRRRRARGARRGRRCPNQDDRTTSTRPTRPGLGACSHGTCGSRCGTRTPPRILIGSGGHTCTAGTKDAIRHRICPVPDRWTARRPRRPPTRAAAASWVSTSSHATHTCLPTRAHRTSPRAHHDWSVRYRRPGMRSRASAARTHSTPSGPVALTPRPRPRPGRRPGPGP